MSVPIFHFNPWGQHQLGAAAPSKGMPSLPWTGMRSVQDALGDATKTSSSHDVNGQLYYDIEVDAPVGLWGDELGQVPGFVVHVWLYMR